MIPVATLLPILRSAATALVASGLAWSAAWYVQGLRLQAVRNDLAELRTTHAAAVVAAERKADALHDQTAAAWAAAVDHLRSRRAAGWVPVMPAAGSGPGIPPAGRADDAGADAVPAAAGTAPATDAALIADCQQTTLQLNQLQGAIEQQ